MNQQSGPAKSRNTAAAARGRGKKGAVTEPALPKYPYPADMEICVMEGQEEGKISADPSTVELQMYLSIKGFPHKVHVLNPQTSKDLPPWFRKNNWDNVLPMTKYDKEQYKLSSCETMMALENKFKQPLVSKGGMGCGRFRGKTLKNLTLTLFKSNRPYTDDNPDWKDLKAEFRELNEYLTGCHNKEGDYMKSKQFSLWDIRMVPALYNLITAAPYFKPGLEIGDEYSKLRSFCMHAFEDPFFAKFKPSVSAIVRYYEPRVGVRIILPEGTE